MTLPENPSQSGASSGLASTCRHGSMWCPDCDLADDVPPQERVGQRIRATHPYGFRLGEWGRVLGIVEEGPNGHPCFQVGFDDEVCDLWVIDDPSDHYEFSEARRG